MGALRASPRQPEPVPSGAEGPMPTQSTEEQPARVSREILERMPLLKLLDARQLDRLAEVSIADLLILPVSESADLWRTNGG